jgi:hypothetical protein
MNLRPLVPNEGFVGQNCYANIAAGGFDIDDDADLDVNEVIVKRRRRKRVPASHPSIGRPDRTATQTSG